MTERLLSFKELAAALNRSREYVRQMRRAGFPCPGKRATLESALRWLEQHPDPCKKGK